MKRWERKERSGCGWVGGGGGGGGLLYRMLIMMMMMITMMMTMMTMTTITKTINNKEHRQELTSMERGERKKNRSEGLGMGLR